MEIKSNHDAGRQCKGLLGGNETMQCGTYLQGEVDGEPRDHALALGVHGDRVGRQLDALVQHRLEVARQPVARAPVADRERQRAVSRVVRVGERGCWVGRG